MPPYGYKKSDQYYVGHPCPFCGVGADDPCRTPSGHVHSDRCHRERSKAAARAGVSLRAVDRGTGETPVKSDDMKPAQRLKIALWFLEKIGGVEMARFWVEAAAKAIAAPGAEPEELAVPQTAPTTPDEGYCICPFPQPVAPGNAFVSKHGRSLLVDDCASCGQPTVKDAAP